MNSPVLYTSLSLEARRAAALAGTDGGWLTPVDFKGATNEDKKALFDHARPDVGFTGISGERWVVWYPAEGKFQHERPVDANALNPTFRDVLELLRKERDRRKEEDIRQEAERQAKFNVYEDLFDDVGRPRTTGRESPVRKGCVARFLGVLFGR